MFRVFVKFSTSKLYKLLLTTYELFVNCTTGNMCSYIYDQIYAIRTCERFRRVVLRIYTSHISAISKLYFPF